MTNSSTQSQNPVKKVSKSKNKAGKAMMESKSILQFSEECQPSEDAIFFVRLFARACQTTC